MKLPFKAAFAVLALSVATPALAVTQIAGGCSTSTPEPDAEACAAFEGNINNGSPAGTAQELNDAVDILTGGDVFDVDWSVVDGTKAFFTAGSGTTLNFAETLFGEQILSIHFGNAGSGTGDYTILYLFDFGTTGADSIVLNTQGYSNAVLVTPPGSPPPVPEPATWAMMMLGFGAVGYSIRRRKPVLPQVA
jgi:hypothetical protein